MRGGGAPRRGGVHPLHLHVAAAQELVRARLDGPRDLGVRRPSVRRVVLEAAVLGRIVRRRGDDAVRHTLDATAVVHEDRMRDHGRRHVAVVSLDHRLDAVGGQHLERRALGRTGYRVGVLAEEQRSGDALPAAMLADRLRDREDVRLGERAAERRAAMTARAEAHALGRVGHVGPACVVLALELRGVDQQGFRRRFAGQRGVRHAVPESGFSGRDST